jgi:hypothetical protein
VERLAVAATSPTMLFTNSSTLKAPSGNEVGTGTVLIAGRSLQTFRMNLLTPSLWSKANSRNNKQHKLHGPSPRANYTDRATVACRRSDWQLLRIKGATWSAWRIPTAVFSFSRQEPLLFYQVAPQLYSRGWVDTVPDPLLFFVVPGIEPGPPDL